MAEKVSVELVDDLDGTAATESIRFALDGKAYVIDLSAKNATAMRKAFEKYTQAGRAAGSAPRGAGGPKRVMNLRWTKEQYGQARAWAQKNGKSLPPRGRIPNALMDEWEAATKRNGRRS